MAIANGGAERFGGRAGTVGAAGVAGAAGAAGTVGTGERGGAMAGAAAGPRVCGLSSARDRARLREREQAERARVEQVLARGPMGPEREHSAPPRACARARRARVAAPAVAACVCRVCGGDDIALDFVRDRGTWRLARCGRCDFMWTDRCAETGVERRGELQRERSTGLGPEPAGGTWTEPRVIRCADASAA
ncbi:MAG: hypothetical protein U0900_20205 [Myxococcota bacterium]